MKTLTKVSLLVLFALPAWTAAAQAPNDADKIGPCLERGEAKARIARCDSFLASSGKPPAIEAAALQARGWAHKESENDDKALADFNKAMEIDPRMWPLMWPRAELNAQSRRYEAALSDWAELSKREPGLASLHGYRGIVLDNMGRSEEALVEITRAIDMAGSDDKPERFQFSRANVYESLGRFAEARAEFMAVAAKSAESAAQAYRGAGRASYLMGDMAGAIQAFESSARIEPNDGYLSIWLFLAEMRAGRPNPAAKLRASLARSKADAWPAPLMRLLLGEIGEGQLPALTSPSAWSAADLRKATDCEAAFYLGELRDIQGNRAQAAQLFQKAINSGIREFVEYRAAAFRLKTKV